MKTLKARLYNQAIKKYGKISPCSNRKTFNECYSVLDGDLLFWFNTTDDSTHIESVKVGNYGR